MLKSLAKVILITAGIALAPILLMTYIGVFGFSFPSLCTTKEIPIDPPTLMRDSDIVFEKEIMMFIIPPHKSHGSSQCPQTIKEEADGLIQKSGPGYEDTDYQTITIKENTKFKFIRAAYQSSKGYNPGDGDFYLLQTEDGKKWYISAASFPGIPYSGQSKWIAGYYKSDQRIGDVVVENVYLCRKSGELKFELCPTE
jgi:hypothetical protein